MILYPETLLNFFILTVFWWSLQNFLCIRSCHLQVVTVSFFLSHLDAFSFFFLPNCSIVLARASSTIGLFLFFVVVVGFSGCVGCLLLCAGFLQLWRAGATLHCGARASHCGGFSCCGPWALGTWTLVVAAHGLSSCGAWALGRVGFSSCGTQAE